MATVMSGQRAPAAEPPDAPGTDATTRWHQLEVADTLAWLEVDPRTGLTSEEAARRLAQHGPNELEETGSRGPLRILWEQLTATMVLILVIAAGLSLVIGDLKDAIVILAIVVLFAVLGFVQEYRAERAMAALKQLAVPNVRVRRDGRMQDVSARELVPGDVVLLEAGNLAPADSRLIEAVNLRVQEAALTGESEPVEKTTAALDGVDLAIGDRRNLAYMGTVVTYGRGEAVVTTTGMRTELGRIATLLQDVAHELTPLQRRLNGLGKLIGVVALGVSLVILAFGLLRGEEFDLMVMTAVSVFVASVPEGLPAVVTITLALGAQRMLRRQALLRKLPAVETLGSVTVICSDKTGTLTENRMTVTLLDVAGRHVDLIEHLDRRGRATTDTDVLDPEPLHPAMGLLLAAGALCNDAVLQQGEDGELHAIGDPTEGALVVAAARLELAEADLDRALPRIAELPFDSDRKRMTTVHRLADPAALPAALRPAWLALERDGALPAIAFVKGAADSMLTRATHVWDGDHPAPMTPELHARIDAAIERMASQGMRILGVGYRIVPLPADGRVGEEIEDGLTFIGLAGMIDPPRSEVKDAVATCRSAGIRPVMITGDHALTALHIAKSLGIADDDRILTGAELERMSDRELEEVVDGVSVFARVSPEHKLRIVGALQAKGHIVAMTGDGVNDAPALKRANIGVAMGITGTDVSKEAADMVLRDDNFATIVAAVEEGRVIYDNIRKFVQFSIGGNIGKILVVLLGTVVLGWLTDLPLPLLPLQLLWLNLLTDGLLGLGLGVEKAERNVMRRAPYLPGESIFARGMAAQIAWVGALIGLTAIGLGWYAWEGGDATWQTMIFTALAFAQIGQALAVRSSHDSLFTIGWRSNRVLSGMALLVLALQLLVIYWSPLGGVFETEPLALLELALCAGAGVLVFTAIELDKWRRRRGEPRVTVAAPTREALAA